MALNLSKNIKGLIYLVGGAITLLYINGWFAESLYYIMLAGSVASFVYGFVVTDAWDFLKNLVNMFRKKDNTNNTTNISNH